MDINMDKQTELRGYYNLLADILKLPYVPELIITEVEAYIGKSYRTNRVIKQIELSAYHLWSGNYATRARKEVTEELIETICHEFAHIKYFEHGKAHTDLTQNYIVIINKKFKQLRGGQS